MTIEEAIKQIINPPISGISAYPKFTEALNIAIEVLLAEVTQGEWVDEDGNKVPLDKDGYPLGSCWCNQCHEWLVGSDEYYTKGNFCPSCGAKMKNRG